MNVPPDHPESAWVRVPLLEMTVAEFDAYIEASVREVMADVRQKTDELISEHGWALTPEQLAASHARIEAKVRAVTRQNLEQARQRLLH